MIRSKEVHHTKSLEFGGGECGKNHEEPSGTKRMIETKFKLPKCLKDMIQDILSIYPTKKNIVETFAIATYGKSQWGLCIG